jgi:hypothetical protein
MMELLIVIFKILFILHASFFKTSFLINGLLIFPMQMVL